MFVADTMSSMEEGLWAEAAKHLFNETSGYHTKIDTS